MIWHDVMSSFITSYYKKDGGLALLSTPPLPIVYNLQWPTSKCSCSGSSGQIYNRPKLKSYSFNWPLSEAQVEAASPADKSLRKHIRGFSRPFLGWQSPLFNTNLLEKNWEFFQNKYGEFNQNICTFGELFQIISTFFVAEPFFSSFF